MKHLEVIYSNGESDFWSIPVTEKLEVALKGIEEETEMEIIEYNLIKGW